MSGPEADDGTVEPHRLVITGEDEAGSFISSDGPMPAWLRRANGLVVMDAWSTGPLPVSLSADSALENPEVMGPPSAGVAVRIAVFPPDAAVDAAALAEYEAATELIYGTADSGPRPLPGGHATDTVDVVAVLSGEIWAVMDRGEVLLRPGDVLVQRGTRHAWSNRSDAPCTLISTMIPAHR